MPSRPSSGMVAIPRLGQRRERTSKMLFAPAHTLVLQCNIGELKNEKNLNFMAFQIFQYIVYLVQYLEIDKSSL